MEDATIFGTIGHARTPEQRAAMEATVGRNVCPFCLPEFKERVAIDEGQFWRVVNNDFPYPHHQRHLLFVLKRHLEGNLNEIPPAAGLELWVLFSRVVNALKIPGGGLVIRFGDPKFNAGTIRHIHAHLQVPDLTGPAKATFAKDPEKVKADLARVVPFAAATKQG
jgi:diadenosine tetraphosphate (Ap4A) HIT family hydrolase